MIINIDGRDLPAQKGDTVLDVAKRHGIEIPTLCYHGAVEPWGGCRVCVVEINKKGWDPWWTKIVTACLYPAEDGLKVLTRSEKVVEARRTVLDLLMARAPNAPRLRELAREYGIEKSSFPTLLKPDRCILCGLCIRMCEAMGANVLSLTGRSQEKAVNVPFGDDPRECIGCLVCAENCPTEAIPWEETRKTRTIWNRTFPRIRCEQCGRPLITEAQADHVSARSSVPRRYFNTCSDCTNKATAEGYKKIAKQFQRG